MEADPVLFDRVQRESEIGEALEHSGVMRVFADDSKSSIYMVMEWVNGCLLRHILREQGPLSAERAVRITVAICDALDYIHRNGIVHRDLKPENFVVDSEDNIKLIDVGIAGQGPACRPRVCPTTYASVHFSENLVALRLTACATADFRRAGTRDRARCFLHERYHLCT